MFDFRNNLRAGEDIFCSSYREAVLDGVKKMKQEENIETSALKVEFITRYQNRGHEVLLPKI